MTLFTRLRDAWSALTAPTPAPEAAPAPAPLANTLGDVTDTGTAVQARDIEALTVDRRTENHGATHHHGAVISDNTGPVNTGSGNQINGAVVHTGRGNQYEGDHYGNQSFNVTNVSHGRVGMQLGNVSGGAFVVGDSAHITGSALGDGAVVNNIGHNDHGQIISAHRIDGGISFGGNQ